MRTMTTILAAALAALPAAAGDIPARPEQIEFAPIEFTPPTPDQFRTELAGVPVYLAPSDELPLVTISFTFKGGSYMESADKVGLAGLTGTLIRTGGTESKSPAEVDEQFEFLAANASVNIGDTTAAATLNCLSSNLDEAFALFMEVVRTPGFDAKRIEVVRNQTLEGLKQRNDDGLQIALREWNGLMFGQDHFAGRNPTGATISSITAEDMRAFHQRLFHPGNMIIAVSGDFDRDDMLARLGRVLSGWTRGEAAPEVPQPTAAVAPGVYYIEKDQPQGQVLIGQRGISRDDPDAIPVRLMNDILGGGGFTSRITNRVRTDEGLAYTAGSVFRERVDYPGDFIAYFFSKSSTVPLATRTVFEELDKIRATAVKTEELETVKQNTIQTFPRTFESKAGTLAVFVSDEWTGRDPAYWQTFREKVEAVSPEDIQRVAREHLDPQNMAVLIVGDWKAISAGNASSEADAKRVATMSDIRAGQSTRIPLKDPVTLQPVAD